jgi:membrane glycosyltransferase
MELHTSARQLAPGAAASDRAEAYLDRLPLSAGQRADLSAALTDTQAPPMEALHRALAQTPRTANPAYASVPRRLALAGTEHPINFAPPLKRRSMVPVPWGNLNPFMRWVEDTNERFEAGADTTPATTSAPAPADPDKAHWNASGRVRRTTLLLLMLSQTALATWMMREVLPYHGGKALEFVMLALFALLFCWVSSGFWTALAGFFVQLRGGDKYLISRRKAEPTEIPAAARTAIVMPICNEDVARVFAGLRATYESVARSGNLEHFEFFILSDSSQADTYVAEVHAWKLLRDMLGAEGRLHYRHRRRRVKRKSGNIDDFCRRWGANYRYMVVLDADSVMTGDCLSTLVRLMEANPSAGIIQTAPRASGRDTFYARMQQFATRVYGELFTAGLHFWQLGEAHYWGHNAIIRLEPFMTHCALAPLPGDGPLDGNILSHDFVEAALMRRAGWGVWIAYDLDGSYEEMPPNLLDELGRDRRWCQGNLMNFRITLASGIHIMHRAVFLTGVMAYASSPIWLMFLMLSTGLLATHTLIEPQYFTQPGQLFPIWPEWHPEKALALFSGTAALLFLPKLLAVLLILHRGAAGFGGHIRLALSTCIELACSMLLAPVRMLFHTHFVIASLLGRTIKWTSPSRADNETGWGDAARKHWFGTLLGIAWTGGVYYMSPEQFWWWLPITGALSLSIPISVLSSHAALGTRLRRMKLLVIPEEMSPPRELIDTARYAAENAQRNAPGMVAAITDPLSNALMCAHAKIYRNSKRQSMLKHAQVGGPDALGTEEKLTLLDDALLLSRLHLDVWSSADTHSSWEIPGKLKEGAA